MATRGRGNGCIVRSGIYRCVCSPEFARLSLNGNNRYAWDTRYARQHSVENFTEGKKYRYIQLQRDTAKRRRYGSFVHLIAKAWRLAKRSSIYVTCESCDIVDCRYKLLVVAQSMRNSVVPDAKASWSNYYEFKM